MPDSRFIYANNAASTLLSGISAVATTIILTPGGAARFPVPAAEQAFVATMSDVTGAIREIVFVTAVVGDTFTVVRAQEGTTALVWGAGTRIEHLWTKAQAEQLRDVVDAVVTVSETPPPDPVNNALWWSSTLGQLFINYNDGTSRQWVVAAPHPPTERPADSTLTYYGTNDPLIDPKGIEDMIVIAAAQRACLKVKGDVMLGWKAVPDYYSHSSPQVPVWLSVKLASSNIDLDLSEANIRFADAPPPEEAVVRTFDGTERPKYIAFGTMENHNPRTFDNIRIYGGKFNFGYTATGAQQAQAMLLIGCGNVRIYNNQFFNPAMDPTLVEIVDDATRPVDVRPDVPKVPGDVLIHWVGHDLKRGTPDRAVISFSDVNLSTMVRGWEYHVVYLDDDWFKITRVSKGAMVTLPAGFIGVAAVTATAIRIGAGLDVWTDNCDDVFCYRNSHRYIRQGYFINYCRNWHVQNDEFLQFAEAVDLQHTMLRGSFTNNLFARCHGEGQCLDLATPRSVLIANNVFDEVRQPWQLYMKHGTGDYLENAKYGTPAVVSFKAGSPGIVQMEATYTKIYNGMRVWFEYRPKGGDELFPGESLDPGDPTVVPPIEPFPAGDGEINRWTTYHVVNYNPGASTYNLKLEDQVDAVGAVLPRAESGRIPVPVTASGPVINFAGTPGAPVGHNGPCIMHTLPDQPNLDIGVYDVLAIGNIATNLLTNAADPEPLSGDDGGLDLDSAVAGNRIFMLSVARLLRRGKDRQQHMNGIPRQAEKVRLIHNAFHGGTVFLVDECEGLEIDGLWLDGQNPGVDKDDRPKTAFDVAQSISDPEAISQGILSGSIRNVHIRNCQGRAFAVQAPSGLVVEDIDVDGFNLNEFGPASGGTIARLSLKAGHKQIGRISIKGGVPWLRTTFDSATWTAGTVTAITDLAHLQTEGSEFLVRNASPPAYNGKHTAIAGTSVPFTFTNVTRSGTTMTGTTDVAHGLTAGALFGTYFFDPVGYNGSFTAIAGTTGTTLKWTQTDDPGDLITAGNGQGRVLKWAQTTNPGTMTAGTLMLPGTDLSVTEVPHPTVPAAPSRVSFTGPLTLSSPDFRPLISDVGPLVTHRDEVIVPSLTTVGATAAIRVPVYMNSLTPRRILIASLVFADPKTTGNKDDYTTVRLRRLRPDGTLTNVSAIFPLDNVVSTTFTGATWAAGIVTATTAVLHGAVKGTSFLVEGFTTTGYNGTKVALEDLTPDTSLQWAQDDPGAPTAAGPGTIRQRAPASEMSFNLNLEPDNLIVDLPAGELLVLEYDKHGLGSAVPATVFRWFALPYTQV